MIKVDKSTILLSVLLIFFIGLFVFFVFKNIRYPLLWADESDTVVVAGRVLKFGYPKVHDGMNVLPSFWKDTNYTKFDVLLHPAWIQYYIAAPAVFVADRVSDIYLKTEILRAPFAFLGILGVLILPLFIFNLFKSDSKKNLVFLILYFLVQLISISLILHIREAREYSAVILLSSILVNLFINYYLFNSGKGKIQLILIFFTLLLLFFSIVQVSYIFITSIVLFLIFDLFFTKQEGVENSKIEAKEFFLSEKRKNLLITLVCWLIFSIPLIFFFELPSNSTVFYRDMNYNALTYFSYLVRIISYLNAYHYLILFLSVKVIFLIIWRKYYKKQNRLNLKTLDSGSKISFYLFFLFLAYVFIISRSPWLFDRYYVFLLPLVTVMTLVDIFLTADLLSLRKDDLLYFVYFVGLVFALTSIGKISIIGNYWYQLNHRYIGPLDAFISYIKNNYQDPQKLKIFTNTEQYSLEYYLGAKTACDDYENCFEGPPDIILPRNFLATPTDDYLKKNNEYLRSYNYKKISLNILNYPVNNIPELSLVLRHLFATPITTDPNIRLSFYELHRNEK